MYFPSLRVDEVGEWLYIGREQLVYSPEFQYLVYNRVLVRERRQGFLVCGIFLPRLYLGVKIELFINNSSYLFRRRNEVVKLLLMIFEGPAEWYK